MPFFHFFRLFKKFFCAALRRPKNRSKLYSICLPHHFSIFSIFLFFLFFFSESFLPFISLLRAQKRIRVDLSPMSFCLFVCLSVCLFFCLSDCLFVCLSSQMKIREFLNKKNIIRIWTVDHDFRVILRSL